jgi:hypothetical protein
MGGRFLIVTPTAARSTAQPANYAMTKNVGPLLPSDNQEDSPTGESLNNIPSLERRAPQIKRPHAVWLTVHKADIDQYTSIEILWQTDLNTLHLLLFRISPGPGRGQLTTEEIGPYRCLAELRQQLCVLFGERSARRICHNPNSWLPPYHLELLAAQCGTSVTSRTTTSQAPDEASENILYRDDEEALAADFNARQLGLFCPESEWDNDS